MGRPKKDDPNRITPERAAAALIEAKGNKTVAYQELRPGASRDIAETESNRVYSNPRVKLEVKKLLDSQGLDAETIVKATKEALFSGLGVAATNKDSVNILKMLYGIHFNNDDTSSEFSMLSSQLAKSKNDELLEMMQGMNEKMSMLMRGSQKAIDNDP